ncbi:dihydroxyacetone kinase subunit DhaL [Thermanaerovibrio velox]|nr:dihydroxyacetone kinase subunit DhaL [Thermanaerovibrio velox]
MGKVVMPLTVEGARDFIARAKEAMDSHKDYLTQLDSAIGDADHGINMSRGFGKAHEKVSSGSYGDLGGLFKDVAMVLMGSVGGASGPLYGTFFMKISMKLAGKTEASVEDLREAALEGLNGVLALGKAQPGDKTMVDALQPALEAMKGRAGEAEALEAAVKAAEEGMLATVPMLAKKGRASYLGERSVGHQDPGATSSYLLLTCLRDAVLGVSS